MSLKYSSVYKENLFNNVLPFWQKNSIDHLNGGYFTCLEEDGTVYDTDKFIWLQGRQAWTFSMLYNQVEKNEDWLQIAKIGIDFLIEHGKDEKGDFYFSVTAEGKPLVKPYNIFSDCFAAMAFSQYAKATGDESIALLAKKTYSNIIKRKDHTKGIYEKNTDVRPLVGFSLPMILSNLVLELEDILDKDEVEKTLDYCIDQVMNVFLDKKTGLIFENVLPDGSHHDSFNGRLINPGHGIEAMWFMIDIAVRRNNKKLIDQAVSTILRILEYSWDQKYGGIFYFMDIKNKPLQQLEWDQKLWWVHLETLVALSKAYLHTNNKEVYQWFEKVHEYSWNHFNDPINGEWYGYLNRQGEVLLNLKGGKWKGCFHVPRALFQCWKTFEKIENKPN